MSSKVTHIQTAPGDSNVRVSVLRMEEMTVDACLRHLGSPELSPMCKTRIQGGAVVIDLAQEKAFTWITHVFVRTAG